MYVKYTHVIQFLVVIYIRLQNVADHRQFLLLLFLANMFNYKISIHFSNSYYFLTIFAQIRFTTMHVCKVRNAHS